MTLLFMTENELRAICILLLSTIFVYSKLLVNVYKQVSCTRLQHGMIGASLIWIGLVFTFPSVVYTYSGLSVCFETKLLLLRIFVKNVKILSTYC